MVRAMEVITTERLEAIVAAHLDDERAEQLLSLVRPSLRLSLDGNPEPAGSRVGGFPLADVDWPEWKGNPLSFLCQLRIGDLRQLEPTMDGAGLLLVFYAVDEQPWGFDPADRGGWRTVLVEDPASARLLEAPEGAVTTPERRITLILEPTLPYYWESEFFDLFNPQRINFDDVKGSDELFAATDQIEESRGLSVHQAFGWPTVIQNPMREEAQLASHGIYLGDADGYKGPRAQELLGGAAEWRLLLQLDSDDDLDWMWGDVGRIYFWIRDEDLQARRFEDTWCILQCT